MKIDDRGSMADDRGSMADDRWLMAGLRGLTDNHIEEAISFQKASMRLSYIDLRSLAISHQPSAIGHRPSAISHQPSAISHRATQLLSKRPSPPAIFSLPLHPRKPPFKAVDGNIIHEENPQFLHYCPY